MSSYSQQQSGGMNTPLVRVKTKYQIVIPAKFRKSLGIKEGDYVAVGFNREETGLLVKPKTMVDKEDAWFWSKEWQKKEREADRSLKKGEYEIFNTIEDAVKKLRK